jgi:hypothetical protein
MIAAALVLAAVVAITAGRDRVRAALRVLSPSGRGSRRTSNGRAA